MTSRGEDYGMILSPAMCAPRTFQKIRKLRLSIIVIFHDMAREAARSIRSAVYQQDVEPRAYESSPSTNAEPLAA
jgi:hypothetical protein